MRDALLIFFGILAGFDLTCLYVFWLQDRHAERKHGGWLVRDAPSCTRAQEGGRVRAGRQEPAA